MTEPLSHLPPGRRMYVEELTNERFSHPLWWETPRPEFVDSKLMQGIRRRALSEALDAIEDEQQEAI